MADKEQRCWMHKTANVLNKLPQSVQPKAKADLHEIWQAETRADATKAFDHFLEKYGTRRASLTMMFKLAQAAQKGWRRLNGHKLLTHLIQGHTFLDGVLQHAASSN